MLSTGTVEPTTGPLQRGKIPTSNKAICWCWVATHNA